MASPGSPLGLRVRWRAGGRLLEGTVIYLARGERALREER
jgi:hypothetical protein